MEAYCVARANYFAKRTPCGQGILAYLRQQAECTVDRPAIHVDHNDYLNMTTHLAVNTLPRSNDLLMSGVFVSQMGTHMSIEVAMAGYVQMAAAHLSQSGYAANVNILQSICVDGMPVYIDQMAHASFRDGISTSQGRKHVFKHNDMGHLDVLIHKYGPGVIVVDSLYRAHGSFAPLEELVRRKHAGGHLLVVDESHSLGLYARAGRGFCALLGVTMGVDFITASLSKAFGVRGGLVAAQDPLDIVYLKQIGTPAIFSSVVDMHTVVRLGEVLQEMQSERAEKRRIHLLAMSDRMRQALHGLEGVVETEFPSPIICLASKTEEDTCRLQAYLQQRGVFAATFLKPAVPSTGSIARITLNSNVTSEECEYMIQTIHQYSKHPEAIAGLSKL